MCYGQSDDLSSHIIDSNEMRLCSSPQVCSENAALQMQCERVLYHISTEKLGQSHPKEIHMCSLSLNGMYLHAYIVFSGDK
jgi:hypothetical protein